MAADWIKWTKGLAAKPEVLKISRALGIHPDHAAGTCMRVWEWADDHTKTGHSDGVDFAQIGASIGCGETFLVQMSKAGWLREENGGVTFPKFARHNSKSAKRRAVTAMRNRRFRNRSARRSRDAERDDQSVTREREERESRDNKNKGGGNGLSPHARNEGEELQSRRDSVAAFGGLTLPADLPPLTAALCRFFATDPSHLKSRHREQAEKAIGEALSESRFIAIVDEVIREEGQWQDVIQRAWKEPKIRAKGTANAAPATRMTTPEEEARARKWAAEQGDD